MKDPRFKLFLRLLWVPIAAIFLYALLSTTVRSLNDLSYYYTENTYAIFLKYDTSEMVVTAIFAILIALHLSLEILAHLKESVTRSRWLTHFRFAPLTVFIFSGIVVALFDIGMIEISKKSIQNYVHSNSESLKSPDVSLHNNYRHWCGNGASAHENYLYFETAFEGSTNDDPFVRARSLLMSARVQNWLNGGDERFDRFLLESCMDENDIVRKTADMYLANGNKTCRSIDDRLREVR